MSDDSLWRPPTPEGAGAPPPPPPPPPQPTLPPASPSPVSPPPMTVPPGPPTAGPPPVAPQPSPATRRPVALVAAVVAVLAVGAAGVFAVTQLVGGDDGGASSPQELGEQVVAALEAEDVLGLIDVLEPGERDVFRDPAIELVDELSRLEVLSSAADLAKVEGIDVIVEDETVTVSPTNVDDITNIEIGGTITAIVDGESLPIGDLLLDAAGEAADLSELDTEDSTDLELEMTAVRVDGRWYLSLFHSIAEQIRADLADRPDIPETGVEPTGGDTPEGALDALLDGVEALSLEQLIAALNPGDAAALQRYAPLFLDEAESALDEIPLTWQIVEREYTVEGDGDTRQATIDLLRIEGEVEEGTFEVLLEDGCVTITTDTGDSLDSCELAEDQPTADDLGLDPEALGEVEQLLTDTLADYDQPGIVLRSHEGRWYVSPIGTVAEQVLAVSRALDRAEIDRLVEELPSALETLFRQTVEGAFPDVPGLDEPLDPPEPSDPGDDLPGDPCFELPDASDAAACYEERLAAGEIEEWEFPIELRFPECGLADAYWEGYYALDDATFIALMEEAGPCFRALVDEGVLDEFDLGPELTDLECFEGRNWYSVFDDPEYDERFQECVYG